MKINEKKLQKQLWIIDRWIANGCKGTLEAATGFGKTYVAILIIQRIHKKYPHAIIDVVVPKVNLLLDWVDTERGHIKRYGLYNVNVYVVNTYIKFERRFPTLLILDEIHNYASDEFGKVFEIAGIQPIENSKGQTPYCLGLSATLERIDGKHSFIEIYCPIIATVSLEEAKRQGYISNYKTFNLGLRFGEEEQAEYDKLHTIVNKTFGRFDYNFPLAMACGRGRNMESSIELPVTRQRFNQLSHAIETYTTSEWFTKTAGNWQVWLAEKQGWDGTDEHEWHPKKISEYAQQYNYAMRNRKSIIFKASVKVDTIEAITNKFPVKTITFCEDTTFADAVMTKLGEDRCKSYHTKVKGTVERVESLDKKGKLIYKNVRTSADKTKVKILADFLTDDTFQVLSTVRSMDEGYDNQKIKMAIMASYNSSKRQNTQRTGRASRKDLEDDSKIAIIINLYMIGSQEEKWLRSKQSGQRDVKWITSIDEITLEGDIIEGKLSLI